MNRVSALQVATYLFLKTVAKLSPNYSLATLESRTVVFHYTQVERRVGEAQGCGGPTFRRF